MRSNPTARKECKDKDCPIEEERGGCKKNNICYKYECKRCSATYHGETSWNFLNRNREHAKKFADRSDKSFMFNLHYESHPGQPA